MGKATDAVIRFKKGVQLSFDDVVRESAIGLARRTIARTPVDTGHLRGNWQLITSPNAPELPFFDKSGGATLARITAQARSIRWGQPYYLTNGAPYAIHIEYGTSRMEPRPMVRSTMREWQKIVDDASKRVSRGANI